MNRYYVIINGINSLTIPGLAIKELPPITKTLMRNQREEIDGRDGDITTELGYSAYDKTMTIGLYGDYDINQIIAFFNQKGTIVFSDEADKYYNFTILERIDYAKLVKFRTASVKFHCQPFKYKLNETPQTITTELVESTGEEATLNNTAETSLQVGLKGNTYQETTTGKNLYNPTISQSIQVGLTTSGDREYIYINGTGSESDRAWFQEVTLPAGTYTISMELESGTVTSTSNGALFYLYKGKTWDKVADILPFLTSKDATFTLDTTTTITLSLYVRTSENFTNSKIAVQIVPGSVADYNFEPYTNGASPNPDYPQEVKVVTGENVIKICGKNIYNPNYRNNNNFNSARCNVSEANGIFTFQATGSDMYLWYTKTLGSDYSGDAGQLYEFIEDEYICTLTNPAFNTNYVTYYDENMKSLAYNSKMTNSFTINKADKTGAKYFSIRVGVGNSVSGTTYTTSIMLESGETASPYIPYQEQNYTIDLGDLELCKIGTYQDYLYKSGDNWYKKCYVRKLELAIADMDNNESYPGWKNLTQLKNDYPGANTTLSDVTDYYCNITKESDSGIGINTGTTGTMWLRTAVFNLTQTQWVTNYADVVMALYYGLQTPYDELITDEALITQLNALQNAMSYLDQTNVTQTYDNMPFILDLKAIKKGTNEITINNTGNIYSKPIMALNGSGMIEININNTEVLRVDMTEHHNIVIDSANMEAYNPDTMALRNRQVTGSYDNLKLNQGANTIKVLGQLTEATISKYERWL